MNKPWWPGDRRVENYMPPVAAAISRHVESGAAWTDIYNRAYEAVFAAIKEYSETRAAENDRLRARSAALEADLKACAHKYGDCDACRHRKPNGGCGEPHPGQLCAKNNKWEWRDPQPAAATRRPEIVCLCGSTRFYKTFDEQNYRLTLEGKIVLSIGCSTKSDEGLCLTDEDKVRLDELHKRKIDLADSVLVLNVGGYVGSSTRSEIDYALSTGKPVTYLE